MTINKRDIKLIICALYEAVEVTESLIEAHRVAWSKKAPKGNPQHCIPEMYRKDVAQWNRRIKSYKRMIHKLGVGIYG